MNETIGKRFMIFGCYVWMDFKRFDRILKIQTEVWTSLEISIWMLVRWFKWMDFEIQTKTNLDSNEGFWVKEIWIQLEILNSRKYLNPFKDWYLTKGDFEILCEIENWLGSETKFESIDLIQIKEYLNSRQGFDLMKFPNLERFNPFQNRKFGIWSKDSNSNEQL
jgi:hypothetical protein